jgi:protein-L-isoaspartate(D-aspartate) O-methyltransferase
MRFDLRNYKSLKSVLFSVICLILIPNINKLSEVMAWRSHGRSNLEMVQNLKKNGIIKDPRVERAMSSVERGNYCRNNPYMDAPQGIGYAVTISAPHMHAHALELLKDHLVEGAKALDVGSGSGYLTACMAAMVGERGLAVGIDHIPELVSMSIENIRRDQPNFIETNRVKMIVGDGREGYPQEGIILSKSDTFETYI